MKKNWKNSNKEKALQMGGPKKIKRQHDQEKFTARERIDKLFDPGSFLEVGMLNHSDMPAMEDKTPPDSKVAGFGKIDGRTGSIGAHLLANWPIKF
ncbi:MAG: carboxyl transferase domain-containing protein [Thermodesulfobacteriota bacterium]